MSRKYRASSKTSPAAAPPLAEPSSVGHGNGEATAVLAAPEAITPESEELALIEDAFLSSGPRQISSSDNLRRGATFTAHLHSLTPMDILQLVCNQRVTAVLQVADLGGNGGRVWLRRGRIVHAETGGLEGVAALGAMLAWPGGEIRELPDEAAPKETITTHWETTLMEAAQLADEFAAGVPSAYIEQLFAQSL